MVDLIIFYFSALLVMNVTHEYCIYIGQYCWNKLMIEQNDNNKKGNMMDIGRDGVEECFEI